MSNSIVVLLALALLVGAALWVGLRKRQSPAVVLAPRKILTANEQSMFWRLSEAFPKPDYVVLAQVSFGALLTAKQGASRNSFSQKIADFVLTDKALHVLAIIEFDDGSHKGREGRDASRDAMLAQAKYKILRYRSIPSTDKLVADVSARGKATRPAPL